jgi:transcriptional regulator with XRE-family HTH domain
MAVYPSVAALATIIRSRREQRGLSTRRAAALAGVSKGAWAGWENGAVPYHQHRRGIEAALQWRPGSVQAVLQGGEPTPVETPDYRDPDTGELYVAEVERRLWELVPVLALDYGDAPDAEALARAEAREHIRLHRLREGMRSPVAYPADVT